MSRTASRRRVRECILPLCGRSGSWTSLLTSPIPPRTWKALRSLSRVKASKLGNRRSWTMTSKRRMPKARASRCYVYITLPGQTKAVTAGRYELTATPAGLPVGHFVYGRSYLSRGDAVELDPTELKLAPSFHDTALLKGLCGAIRDASPDYWGRLIIQRHWRKSELGEMDYLLLSPQDRPGALEFGLNETPPAPVRDFNKTLQLEELQSIAHRLIEDKPLRSAEAEQVQRLLLRGTTMGGARPKAVVEDDAGLWIAKFSHPKDPWNNARVERAMLVLAKACGLQ